MSFFQASDWRGCFVVYLFIALAGALSAAHAASYSGGDGDPGTPYLISTVQDLLDLSNPDNSADWDKHFLMTNDIDMDGVTGFTPIGFEFIPFFGVFDGGGYSVKHLVIDQPPFPYEYAGFFGVCSGAACRVMNLGMDECLITGSNQHVSIGGLIGGNSGVIENCWMTGSITGTNSSEIGGLVGSNGGTITNCWTLGTVTGCGSTSTVGGLIGWNSGAVTDCHAAGETYGNTVGGLVGHHDSRFMLPEIATIANCHTIGETTSSHAPLGVAGGLVGRNDFGTITFSYATGDVSGGVVGGLVGISMGLLLPSSKDEGWLSEDASRKVGKREAHTIEVLYGFIMDCYATGNVEGSGAAGGLIGVNEQGAVERSHSNGNLGRVAQPAWQPFWGGLVGQNEQGVINDCHATGAVTTDGGGLIGINTGRVQRCYASGSISCEGWGCAGLVMSNQGLLENCYATGSIVALSDSEARSGGLAGYNTGTIIQCYATGLIQTEPVFEGSPSGISGGLIGSNGGTVQESYASGFVKNLTGVSGGLVGENSKDIMDCFATGYVFGGAIAGGLVGENQEGGLIERCYSAGIAYGHDAVGALVGTHSGLQSIEGCFWNLESIGRPTHFGTVGLTLSEMLSSFRFIAAGWRYAGDEHEPPIWKQIEGQTLPFLSFSELPGAMHPVTVSSENGSAIITPDIPEHQQWSLITVKAEASPGYVFMGWDFGSGTVWPLNTHTVVVSNPMELQAIFAHAIPVDSIETLQLIGNDHAYPLDGNYLLACDIDAAATEYWNGGAGFRPIGSDTVDGFTGRLDGQGYCIKNLYIQRPEDSHVGLFAQVGTWAYISDICLADVHVSGKDRVGALAGTNLGYMERVTVSGELVGTGYTGGMLGVNRGVISASSLVAGLIQGSVKTSGEGAVGGMVGRNSCGLISACHVSGKVVGLEENGAVFVVAGGAVGGNDGVILETHALAEVTSVQNQSVMLFASALGGLAGVNRGLVAYCSSAGDITFSGSCSPLGVGDAAGGLVGANGTNGFESLFFTGNSPGMVRDCHATGLVRNDCGSAGGLVGLSASPTGTPPRSCELIIDCYSTGDVSGVSGVGGLVGGAAVGDISSVTGSYATGNVLGDNEVGGLLGSGTSYFLINSYATGSVHGSSCIGGLAGIAGRIQACYATGAVMGDHNFGGLVGCLDGDGSVLASFWDIISGGPDNGIGIGLPTAQMKQQITYPAEFWDFSSVTPVWHMCEGLSYPFHYRRLAPIDSIESLQALAFFLDGAFFLTQDIDARATSSWGQKSGLPGFQPIGSAAAPFNGILDGRGHRIFGLHIHRSGEDGVGLFGHIGANGMVRGLGLDQVSITGGNQTGGLAGVNAGTIQQCYVQGDIAGVQEVGGLIGAHSGAVTESYAAATVSGVAPGGLIGVSAGGTVTGSYWDTELSGILSSGGGMGLTTGAMQSQSTYQAAGWDMTGTWLINESISYPYFLNSAPARIVTGPPRLIDADNIAIDLETFVPGVFLTVGGGLYPAWKHIAAAGLATITVPLKQEANNRLVVSVLSETGLESIIARYTVYESAAFPSTPMAVTSLTLNPSSMGLAVGGSLEFRCVAAFADGTTGDITETASWNANGGLMTIGGLYTHRGATSTVQALLHTQAGWLYSNMATVTTAKGGGAKSGEGLVSGVVRSHYTGLGLPTASMTVYPIYSPGVAAQHGMYDALGNYAFFLPESIYHFEGSYTEFRSELKRGGILLEPLRLRHPGPPEDWTEPYYSGQIKSDRPLQYDFDLRPNDPQAPWVYYVEPPASCTVNKPHLVVTAINADKYSELKVATFTLNTATHDVQNRISTTGFYRNTWELELGLNVLHLYSMDTEQNASERTIEVIYDPNYDPSGYTPPEPEGPPPTACVRMGIVNLADGMALRGDAVTLLAEALDGDLGAVDAVSFEMRGAGTGGAWVMLGASINAPHTATWNTALWPAGAYQLRAVAVSLDGCVDSDAALVAVTVAAGAAYHERVESGTHTLTAPVSASTDTVLAIQDGARYARILIPAGALASDGLLTAFFPDAAGFSPALTPWEQDADLYLDVSLSPHTGNFLNNKRATLEVGYPDADADGVLDDAALRVSQLRLKHLPGPEAAFAALPSGGISWHKRCVIGETRHFSVFGVVAEQAAPPLNLLTSALPEGTAGVFYSAPLDANGGIPPYAWSVVSGALPPGLGINGNALEGVPTAPGEYSFTLQVADAQSIPALASVPLTLSIYAASQPTVSITRADGQPGITNTIPLRWDIVFSEPVVDFTVSDILFRGSAAFGLEYSLSGSGAAYSVEVAALPYDGVLHPRVPANVAGNNRASSGEEQVWVDRKAPLLHIACAYGGLQEPGASGPILVETLPVVFTLTFDEPVSGLDAGGIVFDPEVAGILYEVHGSGKDYTLLVTAAAEPCAIMPVVLADAAQDAAGNGNAETLYAGREVQYIPDTRPTVTLNQGAGQADPVNVFPITFDIVFSEAVSGFTVNDVAYLDLPDKAPNPVFALSGGGAAYTLTVTGADGDGRLGFRVPEDVVNEGNQASVSMDNVVSLDTTPPALGIGAPSALRTRNGPVSIPVNYTGASAITLGPDDILMSADPTVFVSGVLVTGAGAQKRIVSLSGISGYGSLSLSIAADTAVDAAGNSAPGAGPSQTIVVGGLMADFDASPISGPAPLTVQFTDLSDPGALPIDDWAWDFGDGEHSYEQHPVYVYEYPGIYTVSLTVTNAVDSDMRIRHNYIAVGVAVPASGWVLLALLAALIACCGAGRMHGRRGRE